MTTKRELQKKYGIKYPGRKAVYLNPSLCESRKIDEAGLQRLKDLHYALEDIYNSMEKSDDPAELRSLARLTTRIEYQLQETWGFKKNKNMHRWYNVPKCKCPKLDNEDALGTKYRIVMGNCPVHTWLDLP